MTAEERADLEARADRSVRRGDLGEALTLFRTLSGAFPEDEALRARLANLEEALQPAELMSAKAAAVRDPPSVAARAPTAEEEGERLYAQGDYAGATAAYRRALEQHPDNQLIRERMEALYRLALGGAAPPAASGAPRLPDDPLQAMETLLERISARRRS